MLRLWRRHQPKVMMTTAVLAGFAGVWLATMPVTATVAMTAAGVQIDGALLTAVLPQKTAGLRLFDGPASLAITTQRGRNVSAGAVMTWGGVATTGRCVLAFSGTGASEACRFTLGPSRVTSVDTFEPAPRVWHRHYSDGVDAAIAVPAGSPLIPIPFPLGH